MAAGLAFALVGCGSMEGIVKSNVSNAHKLAKDGSGVVVGLVFGGDSDGKVDHSALKSACDLIGGADSRCAHQEKYKVMGVISGFGFAAADARVIALVPIEKESIKLCGTPGGKGCTYAKVKAEPGKFGTILEVYKEGENGCHWAGMPRMGGVVCNDWDYRKDMRDWDTTNGVMTVKDN